jgi:hypothetical protein
VSDSSDSAADNRRANAPRFFVLSLFCLCFFSAFASRLRFVSLSFVSHFSRSKADIFWTFFLCSFCVFALILSRLFLGFRARNLKFSQVFKCLVLLVFFSLKSKVLTGFLFVGICPQKPTFFRHSFVAFSLRSP